MPGVVKKSKEYFLHLFNTGDPKTRLYDELPKHVAVLEKWAIHLLEKRPEANKDILLTAVWLHDIGQLVGDREEDHAVTSERVTLEFLASLGVEKDVIYKIAHCVRAHRCKDVQPQTIEAKILAAADSASHFTDFVYISMMENKSKKDTVEKLARDYRDVGLLAGLKEEITPIYNSWKNLMDSYPDWFLDK